MCISKMSISLICPWHKLNRVISDMRIPLTLELVSSYGSSHVMKDVFISYGTFWNLQLKLNEN